MPVEQCRYDRHSQRLFFSERVAPLDRPFLMARQAALLGARGLLDILAGEAGMADAEAARICRGSFANRLASAILAPAGRLGAAARDTCFDVERLSRRFTLRPSRVMERLAALGASGRGFPAAFLAIVDPSGGVLTRSAGAGFPFPRFGPLCARLPIFDELRPGELAHAELILPDGGAFICMGLAEEGARAAHLPAPRRLALVGWRREEATEIVGTERLRAIEIGVTCRLCERADCAHRVHPPMALPAALQEHVIGPSDYELVG
jgi:predicted transcriptional regulator